MKSMLHQELETNGVVAPADATVNRPLDRQHPRPQEGLNDGSDGRKELRSEPDPARERVQDVSGENPVEGELCGLKRERMPDYLIPTDGAAWAWRIADDGQRDGHAASANSSNLSCQETATTGKTDKAEMDDLRATLDGISETVGNLFEDLMFDPVGDEFGNTAEDYLARAASISHALAVHIEEETSDYDDLILIKAVEGKLIRHLKEIRHLVEAANLLLEESTGRESTKRDISYVLNHLNGIYAYVRARTANAG